MKRGFTTSGETPAAPLDQRFGRSPKFLVYDLDGGSLTIHDNSVNLNAAQGAGVQSAEAVARLGVDAVVTGHCGPKAFRVITAAGIAVHTTDAPTVAEAIVRYREGRLLPMAQADVEGHW